VHAPNRPLARTIYTAADTSAAREADFNPGTFVPFECYPASDGLVSFEWPEARHLLKPNTAPNRGAKVFLVALGCIFREVPARTPFVHWSAERHSLLLHERTELTGNSPEGLPERILALIG
jgi:hypothetical protein